MGGEDLKTGLAGALKEQRQGAVVAVCSGADVDCRIVVGGGRLDGGVLDIISRCKGGDASKDILSHI